MNIIAKTKNKASLKMLNYLNSYLFEQECGELSHCTQAQIKKLEDARDVLTKLVSNGQI